MTAPPTPAHQPFEILPGVGIGPFRLGMTPDELENVCREYGLRNEGAFRSGLHVEFQDGRATRIEVATDIGLSLAGEPLTDSSDANVQRLLATLLPLAADWREADGLVVLHWELSDTFAFSFMVYAPGHRHAESAGR